MSDIKKLSSLPNMTSPAQAPMSIAMDGSSLQKTPFACQLAMMLMPFAKITTRETSAYTRKQLMEYATSPTYWAMTGYDVGDVLLISGTTKDTGQKFLFYFLAEASNPAFSGRMDGRCFLFILEGEPPLFPVFSSQ